MNEKIFKNSIIKALNFLNIEFDVKNITSENIEYLGFCSIKNPINNGIYYLLDNYGFNLPIKNCFILSNVERKDLSINNNLIIKVKNPQLTFYKLLNYFYVKNNEIEYNIHPYSIINSYSNINQNISIGPNCYIGNSIIKSGVIIKPNVVIYDNVIIGENVTIDAGSIIGSDGISWVYDDDGNKICQPQIGGVIIKENSYIGCNNVICKGSLNENTIIGKNCLLSHGINIGHGCIIDDNTHISNNVTLPGNVVIGKNCFLGAGCSFRPQIKISDNNIVATGAVVVKDCEKSGKLLVGVPAKEKEILKQKLSGIPKIRIKND